MTGKSQRHARRGDGTVREIHREKNSFRWEHKVPPFTIYDVASTRLRLTVRFGWQPASSSTCTRREARDHTPRQRWSISFPNDRSSRAYAPPRSAGHSTSHRLHG